MKALVLLTILLFLNGANSFGQYFETSYPSDRISFVKLTQAYTVKNLDSLKGEIIDTLIEPAAYIIRPRSIVYPNYLLAIKKEDYYSVYSIDIGNLPHKVNDRIEHSAWSFIAKIYRYRLDTKGSPELIIQFSNSERFDAGNGWSRSKNGYQILDMDKLQIATVINDETYTNWPYGHGMEATGSGTTSFFEYPIYFKNGTLNIEVEGKKRKYFYTKDKLVWKK